MKRRPLGPPDRLRPYIALVSAFIDGDMPAIEFEARYLRLYKDDPSGRTDEEFRVLDGLFMDVDAFVADPGLYEPGTDDIDEAELRRRASLALDRLRILDTRIKR